MNTFPKTFATQTPEIGAFVQDTIGHWYRIIEVRANGWQFVADQVYVSHNSENGTTKFNSYGYAPVRMGRSEFKFSQYDR